MMRFIIIGYRDSYFWNDYGTSVRDLQIAEILSRENDVIFINRPVSIYERLLNKSKDKSVYKDYSKRIRFIDTTSYDIIGPLKGRLWTEKCYKEVFDRTLRKYTQNFNGQVIVIDFTPLANIEYVKQKNVFYWYDLIDNFAIHNRFSDKEKRIVKLKYEYVDKNADLITGVSAKAIKKFISKNVSVMPNGVYLEPTLITDSVPMDFNGTYDLGFVGFVTDKFDVEFINKLSESYSIVIWGKFYDESVINKLSKKIKIAGKFNYSDLPEIMKTFKVGLLPYLQSKSHDESPLKMYEYFKYGRPCISSMDFEIESVWFTNYMNVDTKELEYKINDYIMSDCVEDIQASIKVEWMFEHKIQKILVSLNEGQQ